ncbi:hypothetical protein CEXT_390001 [Caerostris extrusa]|uniref:Uncharacterized protein n=1 Tax=Caerostris extrusa TaxID=172846 RepID=A0AAV4WYB3_CAEEX|nr:hypothetical protein CEXT_390001 [Caerostris extrusa]
MDSDDMNHISVQDDGLPNNPPKYTTFEPDLTSTVFNARSTSTSVISLPPKLIFTLLIIMLLKWSLNMLFNLHVVFSSVYKKHASCVLGSKSVSSNSACYFSIKNKISSFHSTLNSSLSHEEKVLRIICNDILNNCADYNINSMCNVISKTINYSFSYVGEKACEEVDRNKNIATDGINPTYMHSNSGSLATLNFATLDSRMPYLPASLRAMLFCGWPILWICPIAICSKQSLKCSSQAFCV